MPNAWITHVKEYARENNISYACAVSKAKASYQTKEQKQNEAFRQSVLPYYAKKVQKAVRNKQVREQYQNEKFRKSLEPYYATKIQRAVRNAKVKANYEYKRAEQPYYTGGISSNIFFE
jgi:hypothetical protein